MATAKCKQCGNQISDKSIYIEQDVNKKDGTIDKKKLYFCCDECKVEYTKPKPIVENPYNKLNDYIQSLYLSQGYTKQQIPWKVITAQIKQIMSEDKTLNYAQLLYVIKYMVDILQMNLFNEEFNGTILNLVPYYINEAREFCIKCKDIKKLAKEFDFSNDVKIVKVGNREKKVEEMSFD